MLRVATLQIAADRCIARNPGATNFPILACGTCRTGRISLRKGVSWSTRCPGRLDISVTAFIAELPDDPARTSGAGTAITFGETIL
jgi:hypothetical protein